MAFNFLVVKPDKLLARYGNQPHPFMPGRRTSAETWPVKDIPPSAGFLPGQTTIYVLQCGLKDTGCVIATATYAGHRLPESAVEQNLWGDSYRDCQAVILLTNIVGLTSDQQRHFTFDSTSISRSIRGLMQKSGRPSGLDASKPYYQWWLSKHTTFINHAPAPPHIPRPEYVVPNAPPEARNRASLERQFVYWRLLEEHDIMWRQGYRESYESGAEVKVPLPVISMRRADIVIQPQDGRPGLVEEVKLLCNYMYGLGQLQGYLSAPAWSGFAGRLVLFHHGRWSEQDKGDAAWARELCLKHRMDLQVYKLHLDGVRVIGATLVDVDQDDDIDSEATVTDDDMM